MYNIETKDKIDNFDSEQFHEKFQKFKLFSDQISLEKKLSPFSEYDP